MLMRKVVASALIALPLVACNRVGAERLQLGAKHELSSYTGRSASIRTPTKPTHAGQYFIEFRSRHSNTYGHTFVVFGRLNARGEVGTVKPGMVAGLSPQGETLTWAIGHVVPVAADTGWSDGDLEEPYVTNRFRVLLTAAEYAKLVVHIKHKQANSPVWHLAMYNCNLWTGEIAEFLGLRTGSSLMLPADYIQTMKELNTPKNSTSNQTS